MICSIESCTEARHNAGLNKNGTIIYRKKCLNHYKEELYEKRGVSNDKEYQLLIAKNSGFNSIVEYKRYLIKQAGFNTLKEYNTHLAKKAGFNTVADYRNSTHKYRKFRKSYCENIDGRLGYICNSDIIYQAQLHTDHINGNPSDDAEENLQTLCANCHIVKTMDFGDNATPGRKFFKVT